MVPSFLSLPLPPSSLPSHTRHHHHHGLVQNHSLWLPVSDDKIDAAALQFLLQESLLARAEEEEEKAREEAEVKELEEKVARVMQWLAEKVKEVARRDNFHLSPNLSELERTAFALVGHSEALRKKENWKKKKRKIRCRSGFLVSCSS